VCCASCQGEAGIFVRRAADLGHQPERGEGFLSGVTKPDPSLLRASDDGRPYLKMTIGILAIQGDYQAHARMLDRIGVAHRYVRTAGDLTGLEGIILPGGESTTHLKVMTEEGLFEPLKKFGARGGAMYGTCAGAILLAREVHGPPQVSLGLLDASVLRNGYGRQLASDVQLVQTKLREQPVEMVFIRAPIFEAVGSDVEILAEATGHPVLVRQGNILASTFHPELTDDPAIHEYFAKMAGAPTLLDPVRLPA
jgi:5'-phosphate synthase pdxT subunit